MTEVLITCGVGGAGKTTTSAALGVAHALAGKRAVVLTIDPARRLADALGLKQLGNVPQVIPLDAPGSLEALMLDRKATWDDLVRAHSSSSESTERLLNNAYYNAISTRLSGGHEYMATEKLYSLVSAGKWDVVIIDTPPSQHAIDFFRAPKRIQNILNQRFLSALLRPSKGILGAATRSVTAVIRRLAGKQVMGDLEEFFALISDLSEGLRHRGEAVENILKAPTTRYYLAANALSPRQGELFSFLKEIRGEGLAISGFFLNRSAHPLPAPIEAFDETLGALNRPPALSPDTWASTVQILHDLSAGRQEQAQEHERLATELSQRAKGAPVWRLRELARNIEDLEGLTELAQDLPPLA